MDSKQNVIEPVKILGNNYCNNFRNPKTEFNAEWPRYHIVKTL